MQRNATREKIFVKSKVGLILMSRGYKPAGFNAEKGLYEFVLNQEEALEASKLEGPKEELKLEPDQDFNPVDNG